ncbi:MAG: hypothetical protein WC755_08000, partial [Candidatus Woesearchaeota archaeon]
MVFEKRVRLGALWVFFIFLIVLSGVIFSSDVIENVTFYDNSSQFSLNDTEFDINNTLNDIYNTSNDIKNITSEVNESDLIFDVNVSELDISNDTFKIVMAEVVEEVVLENAIEESIVIYNDSLDVSNITGIENITITEDLIIDVVQQVAEIGKPVKWTQIIYVKNTADATLEIPIPENAVNVVVLDLNVEIQNVNDNGDIKSLLTFENENKLEELNELTEKIDDYLSDKRDAREESGQVEMDALEVERLQEKFDIEKQIVELEFDLKEEEKQEQLDNIISGNFIFGNSGFFAWLLHSFGITGYVTYDSSNIDENSILNNEITLVLNTSDSSFVSDVIEIEYETQAPFVSEIPISNNEKEITISSDYHYENILSYTKLDSEVLDSKVIKLYHIVDGKRERVTDIRFVDTNNNGLVDTVEWITPHLSNETYILLIDILNIHSYPYLHGNWTVVFSTYGTSNLEITAFDGTIYETDISPLELKCGDVVVPYSYVSSVVYVDNYSCNDLSYFTVYEMSKGRHTQKFVFGQEGSGGDVGYAYNDASGLIRFVSKPYLPKTSPINILIKSSTASSVTLDYDEIDGSVSGTIVCTDLDIDGIWDCPFIPVLTSNYSLTANGAGDSVSMNISFIDANLVLMVSLSGGNIIVDGSLDSSVLTSYRPLGVYKNGVALSDVYNNFTFNQRYFNLTVNNLTSSKKLFLEYVDGTGARVRQNAITIDNNKIYGNYYYDLYQAEDNVDALDTANVYTDKVTTGTGLPCIGTCSQIHSSNSKLGYNSLKTYTGNNKIVSKFIYGESLDIIFLPGNPFRLTIKNTTVSSIDTKTTDMVITLNQFSY